MTWNNQKQVKTSHGLNWKANSFKADPKRFTMSQIKPKQAKKTANDTQTNLKRSKTGLNQTNFLKTSQNKPKRVKAT